MALGLGSGGRVSDADCGFYGLQHHLPEDRQAGADSDLEHRTNSEPERSIGLVRTLLCGK